MALHDAQQDVVARHVEALAELLLGKQRHRGAGAFEVIGIDDEVGGAAADIDAGDAERAVGRPAARLGGDLEEAARVAAEIARDLGVEIDELGAARLVPVGQHARRRRRRIVELPAHHHPHEVARRLGALAEDQALGQRHAGRQGEHDAAQPARRLGMRPPAALLRRIHQGERLQQHLGQHEGHDRGARVERLEHRQVVGRIGVGIDQVQRLALLVDELRHRSGGGRHRRLVLGIGDVETPFAGLRFLVPQIALGARHAGVALGAAPARGEPRRFRPDPRHGRPHEGIGAAAQPRQMVLAEPGLGELDPRFERLGVHALGMREIAQGKLVGVVQVDAQFARRLDQEAAGARVADIEHQVDLDGAAARPLGVADQLDRREVHGIGQQAEEGEIARDRLLRLLLDVAFDLLERGARMELAEQLLEPLGHPVLAQQPVIGALLRGEHEERARRHVLGRGREIGAALGLGDQAGVEGQHGAVAVALLVAIARAVARLEIDHAHARPVGRAFAELVVGPHLQERHRHPFVEKGRQRVLGGDHEVGIGGAAAAALDHLVLAAHLVEIELHQVIDRLVAGGVVEAPFARLQAHGIEAEIEELDAGAGNQRRRAGVARQAGKIAHVTM